MLTLALNQNPNTRPSSFEGRRITLYQGEANELEDDASKPGTPGLSQKVPSDMQIYLMSFCHLQLLHLAENRLVRL